MASSLVLRLDDIIEAAGRVQAVLGDLTLDTFEADWQPHWLVTQEHRVWEGVS